MIWIGDLSWFVFGSHALGDADEKSDVDIMFDGPTVECLETPYWLRQKSFFETRVPTSEVWLCLPDEKRLMPFANAQSELKGNDEAFDFVMSQRKQIWNLSPFLAKFIDRTRPDFSREEFADRVAYKRQRLAAHFAAWKESLKETTAA